MHQYEKVLNVQLSLGEMRGCKDKSFKKPNLKTCYKIEAKGGKCLYKDVIFEILFLLNFFFFEILRRAIF